MLKTLFKKSIFVVTFYLALMSTSSLLGFAHAAPCQDFNKTVLGIPTWYKYLEGEEVGGKCKPIINATEDTLPIGLAVLEAMLTLGGIIAAIMVFIGGFKYVLAQGEPDKAAGGRRTVTNALIGLAITILAARVVSFIAGRLG